MKRLSAIVAFASFVAVGVAADRESPAGVYIQSAGIYAITLTLLTNGNYLARWDGDIGSNGTASGSWEAVGDEVRLSPKKEEDMMKGYLRVLLLRQFDRRQALLRKEDVESEKFVLAYFFLQKPPSHSPEPARGAAH